jgi:single-strand DNA-binding protein
MNVISIVGNLGDEPQLRFLPNGTPVCDFNVAVNRRYTNAAGEQVQRTTWVKVTAWRGLAQTCATYLVKGREVAITGVLEEPDGFVGRDGVARARNRVTITNIDFLRGSRQDADDGETMQEALDAAATVPLATEDIPF